MSVKSFAKLTWLLWATSPLIMAQLDMRLCLGRGILRVVQEAALEASSASSPTRGEPGASGLAT